MFLLHSLSFQRLPCSSRLAVTFFLLSILFSNETVAMHLRPARVWSHDTRHACYRHMALSAQYHGSILSACACRGTLVDQKPRGPEYVFANFVFLIGPASHPSPSVFAFGVPLSPDHMSTPNTRWKAD